MQPGFLEFFFAGIGLVHLGLKASGWRCVYANDISDKKKEMYLHEMPDAVAYYHCEDIWKTDSIVKRIKEPALLATAAFPCIDLSPAGHMKGMKGEQASSAVCVPVIEWIDRYIFSPVAAKLGYEMLLQETLAQIPAEIAVLGAR
jgi:site-specific DNA-cytosine methylase